MAESILYADRAARAEAEGLRHGKHSSLPKRVVASHSLRQQQMRHSNTQTQRFRTFFHTHVFTPEDEWSEETVMNSIDGYRKIHSQKKNKVAFELQND